MNTQPDACARALANLNSAIVASSRFPDSVFVGDWENYFFFDSDWMFNTEFPETIKKFLAVEGSACACLFNLDVNWEKEQDRFLCLDRSTTPQWYKSMLYGTNVATSWILHVDRYACTSDVAQWGMYCERNNEIAVIAIRHGIPVERYLPLVAQFKAERLENALAMPLSYGFTILPPDWRERLLKSYPTP